MSRARRTARELEREEENRDDPPRVVGGRLLSSSEQLNTVRRARAQLALAKSELRGSVELGEQLELSLEALDNLDLELLELQDELEDEA